jgi:hypothetical protein
MTRTGSQHNSLICQSQASQKGKSRAQLDFCPSLRHLIKIDQTFPGTHGSMRGMVVGLMERTKRLHSSPAAGAKYFDFPAYARALVLKGGYGHVIDVCATVMAMHHRLS